MTASRASAGLTLIEILVSIGVLAAASTMVGMVFWWAVKAQWDEGRKLPVAVASMNLDRVLYPFVRSAACIVAPPVDTMSDVLRAYQDCDCGAVTASCRYVVFCLSGNNVLFVRGTGSPPPTDCSAATVRLIPDWTAASRPADGPIFRRTSAAPNVINARVELSTAPGSSTTWLWQAAIATQGPVTP